MPAGLKLTPPAPEQLASAQHFQSASLALPPPGKG